jgi:puromycin-sensitive aminopeptidase
MSTYLLAFVFGKLDFKEQKTNDGVVVRTYSTPGNLKYTKFCLDTAVKCLEFYNDYFNIDYPLEKCDFVALPDFAAGAMENWGLITCREQAMLVDSKNTSLYIKQHVALVIAHELAHQWFGNLVTMKWWSDLWLNEGFASWIEHLALDKLFPQWQAWTQFAIDDSAPAFRLDALANSHPVKAIINNPDEIRSIFDSISYSKGSSLINMLHNYLGPELFIKGLRSYLKTYAYSNADTDDLWKALEKESKLPVFDFMNTWTSQIGFPMVFATVKPTQLYLKQERFLLNPISRKSYTNDVKWPIPLLIDQNNHELFDSKEQTKKIVTTKALKLNTGQTGFYRVKYDSDHLEKLSQEIRDNKLSPLDRLGLISDIFESAKAGFSTTNEALKLISNFSQEEDYVVWTIIATNLSSLRSVMNDSSVRKLIKPYTRSLISLQLKRLGWEEKSHESHLDKLLRTVILGLAAAADEPSVLKRIKEEFNSSITSDDISPDLRSIVYPTIARKGSVREFNKMLKIYKESDSSEVRVTLTAALTNFQQSALIIRALDLIISDEVRLQDVFYWIAYGFGNRHAKTAMWEWTIDHWEWLKKNLGDDISFYRLPLYCASAFSDISFLPTYRKFFNKVSTPALSSSIKQGVEVIQWQSAWKKRDLSDIKKYFAQSS